MCRSRTKDQKVPRRMDEDLLLLIGADWQDRSLLHVITVLLWDINRKLERLTDHV